MTDRTLQRTGTPWRRAGLVTLIAGLALVGTARAVTVAPIAVYLDSRARSGTVTLFNNGARAEEIRIDFAFGYPVSDSAGAIAVDLLPEAPAGQPSAVPWIRAFPQQLVLQPGQRQVVRILAEPPSDLAPGEYWARVLVKSRGGLSPIEQRQGDVSLQLDIETVLALGLAYRNGEVSSAVELESAYAVQVGDTVVTTIDVRRIGNAAFVGRVTATLLDADGRAIGEEHELALPVHYELRRVLRVPTSVRASQVRIRIDNVRDDLPANAPLPSAPIVRTVEVSAA